MAVIHNSGRMLFGYMYIYIELYRELNCNVVKRNLRPFCF